MFRDFLKDLLFPVDCQGCGRSGGWLCPDCFRRLLFSGQKMLIEQIRQTYIAGNYDDPLLAELIKSFKYEFISGLAQDLGNFLAIYWSGQIALEPALGNLPLVPIPLAKRRERWRGYNQAYLLAQEISRRCGTPLCAGLVRPRPALAQAQLNAQERQRNLPGSFIWRGPDIYGSDLVLIDDIVTTGATFQEGARALHQAGARHVYALALAKG